MITKLNRICASVIASIMLIAFLGCREYNNDEQEQPSTLEKERNIDRLRSIPYVVGITAPKDEPTGVIFFDKERTCPGFRLYTINKLSRAELITEEGKVVRKWHHQPSERWARAELLPNGDLIAIGMEPYEWKDGGAQDRIADSSRYVIRLDWFNRPLWKRKLLAHHDIELIPDGRLLLLTFNRRIVPSIHPTIETRDDQLSLLEEDGTLVESRSMLEAIQNNPGAFPLQPVEPSGLFGPPMVDLFHSNSIEWMHHNDLFSKHPIYGSNNILVSFRHQDRIAIFNWPENKVVWSWGQDQISCPHDAQVLDNGHILLFDNGVERGWSRAIEINPLNRKIVWEFKDNPPKSFYTASKGSAQRLPNGNTLLAESDRGRAIEVTPDGEVLWKFLCPYRYDGDKRAAIVRMVWYPHETIEKLINPDE